MAKIIDYGGKGAALSGAEYDSALSILHGIVETRTVTGADITSTDQGKIIEGNKGTELVINLDLLTTITGAIDTDNFTVHFKNVGAGDMVLTPDVSTDTVDGAATFTLKTDDSCTLTNGGATATDWIVRDYYDSDAPQVDAANSFTATQTWAKGADKASATALDLSAADGNYFDVTGTTTITSISTLGVGTVVKLHFDGALILTHHATDLILPGGGNITTVAGDEAEFVEYASGDWRCTNYSSIDKNPQDQEAFSAHKNGTGQTGIGNGTWTLVTWSTSEFDTTGGDFSLTNEEYIPSKAGKYLITACVGWTNIGDTFYGSCGIYKNGVLYKRGTISSNGSIENVFSTVSAVVDANGVDDDFRIYALHNDTGGTRDIRGAATDTYFTATRL